MKLILKTMLLFIATLILNACDKDNDKPITEIDKLPPATQIGANTAGCLVNGQAYLPYGYVSGGNLNLFYNDESNFGLSINIQKKDILKTISVAYINQKLEEGHSYTLKQDLYNMNIPNGYAYFVDFSNSGGEFHTTNSAIGEIKITHYDSSKAILSGVFWFDAVNSEGEKVEIREGRFDMHY